MMHIRNDMDGNTFRQGYLQRKKAVAKSVRKRWFCLNSDAFITYKSEDDARNSGECLDVLPLINVQTVKKQYTNSQKYPFEIITLQKTHVFMTESAYEQDQWVKAFHAAMQARCFTGHTEGITSKYGGSGKDRRSSAGTRKLSQIKKYVQDGLRPGTSTSGLQRKSSGVECDANETEYQGIPIGTVDNEKEHDDIFEVDKAEQSSNSKVPQTVRDVAVSEGNGVGGGKSRAQSRASDDSGQGSHDVRNLDSSAGLGSTNGVTSSDGESHCSNGNVVATSGSTFSPTPPPVPPPVPSPKNGRRSQKRVIDDEAIYDTPAREDEDIYDVPPREAEEEEMGVKQEEIQEDAKSSPSAINDLKRLLCDDAQGSENVCDHDKEADLVPPQGTEEVMSEKPADKSAMDELKNLLDSLEEL
ncbi:uncharacterized protein [Diadema setosum]|uniref:uncharacterized protein n=1 Tax=Diadema setosum TaxID=31175 RepID=UPI003B3A7812